MTDPKDNNLEEVAQHAPPGAVTLSLPQRTGEKKTRLRSVIGWALFLAAFTFSMSLFLRSGGPNLDDEIGHYLICHHASRSPALLLDAWGRVVNNLVYFLPAQFGLGATRLFSIFLMCLTAWVTYRLARQLGVESAYLVPALLWFQPWVLETSHACLTEVPFTLFLTLGIYFHVIRYFGLAGLAIGLLPLVRHEGIALAAFWGLNALLNRRWLTAALLAAPTILYNIVSYLALGILPAAIFFIPQPPTEDYGRGVWLHFAWPLMTSIGPVWILALYGLPLLLKSAERITMLVVPVFYLALHVIIFKFGLFASGGYVVFLLPIAPMVAIAAAIGLDWLANELRATALSTWFFNFAAEPVRLSKYVVCGAMILVLSYALARARPRPHQQPTDAAIAAAKWLRETGADKSSIVATNVNFYHEFPLPLDPGRLWKEHTPIDAMPAKTIVVWDSRYSDQWGLLLGKLQADSEHWELLRKFGPNDDVVVFRRR